MAIVPIARYFDVNASKRCCLRPVRPRYHRDLYPLPNVHHGCLTLTNTTRTLPQRLLYRLDAFVTTWRTGVAILALQRGHAIDTQPTAVCMLQPPCPDEYDARIAAVHVPVLGWHCNCSPRPVAGGVHVVRNRRFGESNFRHGSVKARSAARSSACTFRTPVYVQGRLQGCRPRQAPP